jgi:hypothetical protein
MRVLWRVRVNVGLYWMNTLNTFPASSDAVKPFRAQVSIPVMIREAEGNLLTKASKMKRSETTKEKWEDLVETARHKEVCDWIKVLTQHGCGDIQIVSTDEFGIYTTIIYDSEGDFYVIEEDQTGETLGEAVKCRLVTENIAKVISDLYISRNTKK